MTVLTRQACIDQLPSGSHGLVVALHVAATASERHASRVVAAYEAARAYLESGGVIGIAAHVHALLALEFGGIGGPGGYGGDATARMSWACGLGKGRRHATDGAAWTAAIEATTTLPDVIAILPAIASADLEWPLAFALRNAYAFRDDREIAAEWAALAVGVASRCEPDSCAGRLAHRYDLHTLSQAYRATAVLRDEIVAEMLGVPEASLAIGTYSWTVADGFGGILEITAIDARPVSMFGPGGSMYSVRIETREPGAITALMRRAWKWCDGERDHEALTALHCTLDKHNTPEQVEALRRQWDAEDDAAVAAEACAAMLPGWEDRAVARACAEGVIP